MIPWEKEGEKRKFELETERVPLSMLIPIIFGGLMVIILGILAALKYLPLSLVQLAYKNLSGGLR
jgi:hypothetical protein